MCDGTATKWLGLRMGLGCGDCCHVMCDGTVMNLHAVLRFLRLSEGELCVCLFGGNDMLQFIVMLLSGDWALWCHCNVMVM